MKALPSVVVLAVLASGLACGGGGGPSATSPATQEIVEQEAQKNGQLSPDGREKLQVSKKKQRQADGEIVWVLVEEWVPVDEWEEEIVVVDEFVEADEIVVVELEEI